MELLSEIAFGCTFIDDDIIEIRGRTILRDDIVAKNQTLFLENGRLRLDGGFMEGNKTIQGETKFENNTIFEGASDHKGKLKVDGGLEVGGEGIIR